MADGTARGRNSLAGEGREGGAGIETSADAAVVLLLRARRPLVYGLERATVEAQRRAVGIAELIGGVIDPTSSASHGASVLAYHRLGQVSATLGEVRERADLVVYWGVDPDVRFRGFRTTYVDGGAAPARTTVAVDIGEAVGPPDVDERIDIGAALEFEALWILRTRLRGRRVELGHASSSAQRGEAGRGLAVPAQTPRLLAVLDRLAVLLRGCRYGVILHDADPPPERRDALLPLAISALAIEANRTARVRLIGVRRPGNAVGAETVLTWQTGFPFAVDFSRGYPRYGPGEFTAERLLVRGEIDAALLVGVDPPVDLSQAALAHLERIPTIVVGGPDAWSAAGTRARFVTLPFEALGGSIYRMDGVALRRRHGTDAGRTFRSLVSSEAEATTPLPASPRWGEEFGHAHVPEDAAILARLYEAILRRLSMRDSHTTFSTERSPCRPPITLAPVGVPCARFATLRENSNHSPGHHNAQDHWRPHLRPGEWR